jgi:hypothetical protein
VATSTKDLAVRRALTSLLALLALALLTAACESPEAGSQPTTASSPPAPTPTPAPTLTPGPSPEPSYPLTGAPVKDPGARDRPVLAVKVDNHRNARPQAGLDHADVVMVEPVENATRFIAMFHSQAPERVGPVRSARFVDAELLPGLHPALAFSGAAEPVLAELRSTAQLGLYREGSAGAWARDSARRAPHDLFAAPEPLFEAAAEDGLPAADQPWPVDDAVTSLDLDRGRAVTGAALSYPDAEQVDWQRAGERFLRAQNGVAHELADGTRVAADNVLIVRVPATADLAHPFDPIGSGELVLLRDGREFTGTWEKPSARANFRWLGPQGQPLRLARGTTWIELVPEDGSVTVRDATSDAGASGSGEGS